MTERWPADAPHIAEAVKRLRGGSVIAFPTDTLYAVAARAADPDAVARLYAIKMRPSGQPMVWLVRGQSEARSIATMSERAESLMARFWPGPLTLVLPAKPPADAPTIALRAPDHPVALALLEQLGEPVASSSANRAGAPPPVDADQVVSGLGDDLDLVLDGGPCRVGKPSTILDMSGDPPKILRRGAIPWEQLIPA